MEDKPEKKTVGRRERVNFPLLDIYEVEAKIDTGAFTSAIHCSNIREEILEDGSSVIRFRLLHPSLSKYDNRVFEFKEYARRNIKSSFGDVQERYVIKTQIQIYEENIETEFSLSDRSDLKYPVLIGRSLLSKHFVVDVAKKNVAFKQKRKKAKKQRNQL
ncbi:ATP-dependent zinc protease family protein [Adhaeribacter aquaticus]|uniref:ATP-dependent zinc protease family protein n=1 Tax=Adhaeribacter aquaticus TaxID=299567 RepID=UPI0003F78AF8|nr:ATP-dependent zinc protease [Adhaeribacter aquaticus]